MSKEHPEALRLAAQLEDTESARLHLLPYAAAELRRLHAENESLRGEMYRAKWSTPEREEALRAQQPLTDEQIDRLLPEIVNGGFTVITYGRAVARAIEAAHNIGEKK